MACAKPTDCAPCSKCPPTPTPVMPRCNVVLVDGSFSNATVVVDDGCIVAVNTGNAPLYQPDPCCTGEGGGGGGGPGTPGGQGDPGDNATIDIGVVSSLAPGAAPTVTNVGTNTHAVLNFGIPRGAAGQNAQLPPGANTTDAGFVIEDGIIKTLPMAWPPVMTILTPAVNGAGVTLTATEDADGYVTLQLDVQALIDWFGGQNDLLQAQINVLAQRIDALEVFHP